MLKSAIIGLGNAGFLYDHKTKNEILTHTKAYNYSVNTNLECVSEIDDKKTEIFKSLHNIPVYKNYIEMLKKHNIDIISIATNNETHTEILKNIADFDIKYIFCEKPLSNNLNNLIKIYEIILFILRRPDPPRCRSRLPHTRTCIPSPGHAHHTYNS